jgi:hypothetical protein
MIPVPSGPELPDRPTPGQPNPGRAPWGHSISSHALFDGCCQCPDRTLEWEIIRWREWATRQGVQVLLQLTPEARP